MSLIQILAQDVSTTDWPTNIAIDVMLLVLLIAVYVWRKKAFEAAVDGAADGKQVSLRGAYNQFLVWMLVTLVSCIGAGVFSTFYFVEQFN